MSSPSRSPVRPSLPPRSPSPLQVRRKRASTKTLLGPEYETMITEVLAAPKPEKNAQDYNKERLKQALKYADSTLRSTERNLSPLGMRAVLLYKDAVASLLDLEENMEPEQDEREVKVTKESWLSIIRTHEQSIQYTSCLLMTDSSDAQTLQDAIINLQRIAFFARYGDAFADVCKKLRREAEAQKVMGWRTLVGGYWTNINKQLVEEKPAWKKIHAGANKHSECPTHLAISRVCRSVGFDTEEMLVIVELYATRNQIVHADLETLIENGQLDDLKKRLYNDFCDIPRVISAVEGLQAQLMSKLLRVMIDRWFTPDETDSDNIQLWTPTKNLKDYYKELRENKSEKGVIYQRHIKEIVHEVSKRLRDEAEEKRLVQGLGANFGLTPGTRPMKRVASAHLQAEAKRAKVMERDWAKLMNMAAGIRKVSDAYVDEYGSLTQPPRVVYDPHLD